MPLWLFLAAPALLLALSWLGMAVLRQGGLQALQVPVEPRVEPARDPILIERGRQLALLGNCAGCHTRRGGAPWAGGRAFDTDYGTVYSSNLTPSRRHGLGDWSLAEFRHAMRHGVSRNGALSPAFPFASFAHLEHDEVEALFVFLASLPAVDEAPPQHRLEFPANLPGAMLGWRLLHHRPARLPSAAQQDVQWHRGRALVEGIGHCAICHGRRGNHAAIDAGAGLAGQRHGGWYAPALDGVQLARYDVDSLAAYLREGRSEVAAALGPMADVVYGNLRHLDAADAEAMARYLLSLPPANRLPPRPRPQAGEAHFERGAKLYGQHCADCHGEDGLGLDGASVPLARSTAVLAADPVNAINAVLLGGGAPSTAGNPRPAIMPPFAQHLDADEIAAVVSYLRRRFGNDRYGVSAEMVRAHAGAFLQ